jgi:hypothetical protein
MKSPTIRPFGGILGIFEMTCAVALRYDQKLVSSAANAMGSHRSNSNCLGLAAHNILGWSQNALIAMQTRTSCRTKTIQAIQVKFLASHFVTDELLLF